MKLPPYWPLPSKRLNHQDPDPALLNGLYFDDLFSLCLVATWQNLAARAATAAATAREEQQTGNDRAPHDLDQVAHVLELHEVKQ